MNTTIQPNPTTNEISPLKIRCNRMGIYVPGNNPTPAEIIRDIDRRLAAHMKHPARTAGPRSGDYLEWQEIHDAYQEFLTDLRAANTPFPPPTIFAAPITKASENKIPLPEPGKIPQLPTPQQTHARNEPGINPEHAGINLEKPGITQNHPGKFPDQIGNSDHPKPAETPIPLPTPPQNVSTSPDEDPDAPPEIQSTDEEFVAAATALHYQRKGRSPFDKLSLQEQAIIVDLLDKFTWQTVLKTIGQPPPIGFALKTSKSALYDFHKRYDKRRKQQNIQANLDLLAKSSDSGQAFTQIFERFVQTKALTVASDTQASLSIFDALITSVNKIRKQSLAERKQAHAEKKSNAT